MEFFFSSSCSTNQYVSSAQAFTHSVFSFFCAKANAIVALRVIICVCILLIKWSLESLLFKMCISEWDPQSLLYESLAGSSMSSACSTNHFCPNGSLQSFAARITTLRVMFQTDRILVTLLAFLSSGAPIQSLLSEIIFGSRTMQ